MKRSEMLHIISILVHYCKDDNLDDDQSVERILDYIEEDAGMLPPTALFENYNTTTDDLGNEYPGTPLKKNQWEPE